MSDEKKFTPIQIMEQEDKEWKESFELKAQDGLIIMGLKWLFGVPIWRGIFRYFLSLALYLSGTAHAKYASQEEARGLVLGVNGSLHDALDSDPHRNVFLRFLSGNRDLVSHSVFSLL